MLRHPHRAVEYLLPGQISCLRGRKAAHDHELNVAQIQFRGRVQRWSASDLQELAYACCVITPARSAVSINRLQIASFYSNTLSKSIHDPTAFLDANVL